MKMRQKTLIAMSLLAFVLTLVFAACNRNPETEQDGVVTGFDIAETATAEIGSYFLFEQLDVKVDGVPTSVIYSGTADAKDVYVSQGKMYIASFALHQAVYSISVKGVTVPKQTSITVTDTSAPVISVDELKKVAVFNEKISLDGILVADNSGEEIMPVITVYAAAATNIGDDTVTIGIDEDNMFTAPAFEGFVTVKIEASDSRGNAAETVYAEIEIFEPLDSNVLFGFDEGDSEDYTILRPQDPVSISVVRAADIEDEFLSQTQLEELKSGAKGSLLKISAVGIANANTQSARVAFPDFAHADKTQYGFIDIKFFFSAQSTAGSFSGSVHTVRGDWKTTGNKSLTLNQWNYVRIYKADYVTATQLGISVAHWNTAGGQTALESFNVYVEAIIGGYDRIVYDPGSLQGIDLTAVTGLSAAGLQNVLFNDAAVPDVTSIEPGEAGYITFDAVRPLRKTVRMEIQVILAQDWDVLENYDGKTGSDFNLVGANLTLINRTIEEDVNGKYLQMSFSGNNGAAGWVELNAASFANIRRFDWFEFRIKGVYDGASASAACLLNGKYERPLGYTGDIVIRADWQTWRFTRSQYDALFGTGALQNFRFYVTKWNAADLTVCVGEVKGGYDDIAYAGEPVDLTAKLGLAASEFDAVFTPTGGSAAAVTDVGAFAPAESGILTVTVSTAGYKTTVIDLAVTVAPEWGSIRNYENGDSSGFVVSSGTVEGITQDPKNPTNNVLLLQGLNKSDGGYVFFNSTLLKTYSEQYDFF